MWQANNNNQETDDMGEQERQDYQKRLVVMRLGLLVTSLSLMLTLLFGVRAWASLPERVEKLEIKTEKNADILVEIRAALSRIEGKLEAEGNK